MPDLDALRTGPLYPFRDWPNAAVPRHAAGVYSIWHDDRLVYVGMAGRDLTAKKITEHRTKNGKPKGLYERLAAHASGWRGGDMFCVYVGDRLVMPALTRAEAQSVQLGEHRMEVFIRRFIRAELSYRFLETPDGTVARELEAQARSGDLGQLPVLNGRA